MGEEDESAARLLDRVPLFEDLSREELMRISRVAVPRRFPEGTRVFHEGDESDSCYDYSESSSTTTWASGDFSTSDYDTSVVDTGYFVSSYNAECEIDVTEVIDDIYANAANYGVVIDAWSLHYLRSTPDGWTGDDCGTDSTAIGVRVADVFNWFQTATSACDPADVIVSTPGTDPTSITPARTLLMQNTPNPFNPRTTVRYQLATKAHVKLVIFDVSGKVVRTLVAERQSAGRYQVRWEGTDDRGMTVSSGIYFYQISTGEFQDVKRLMLLK